MGIYTIHRLGPEKGYIIVRIFEEFNGRTKLQFLSFMSDWEYVENKVMDDMLKQMFKKSKNQRT